MSDTEQNDATQFTEDVNQKYTDGLPFADDAAYEEVRRGLVKPVEDLVIDGPNGPVWSLNDYKNQMAYPPAPACPETVNPSLWRMATLNSVAGLFEVTAGVYQVRAYDMSNMTIIEGGTGLIIIDPLISTECATAALNLFRTYYRKHEFTPVKAVIYTHSHVDHFGGVRGVVPDGANVEIFAPAGFLEHAVSENVYAGTAMGRRAQYMYGPFLARGDKGQVDCGLGKNQSTGTVSLLAPTKYIETNGTIDVAGLKVEFQLTPGSEAPAEMNFFFHDYYALCGAENVTHNMHNLQTLRGAHVRDGLAWSKYLNEAIDTFGKKTEVLFAQHHWPVWGPDKVNRFLRQQRDLYRYLNDQTLRLLNNGYTGIEIAETFKLPGGLDQDWSCRGYYGSVSHNVKAVYDRYMGWFDGNPSTLHALPPTECGPKYVDAMGGVAAVLEKAQQAYFAGDYRWTAQLLTHVVFTDPSHAAAKRLQADALEQLGYQAETATWRNFYLMGAQELRDGVVQPEAPFNSEDMITQLTEEMVFDLFACRIDGPSAAAKNLTMTWTFTDLPPNTPAQYLVELSNGALSSTSNRQHPNSTVVISLHRSALNEVLLGKTSLEQAIKDDMITISTGQEDFEWFMGLLTQANPQFNIVTPKEPELPSMEPPPPASPEEVLQRRGWRLLPPPLKGC